ncbi:hypothetical protein NDA18_000477 [Ustilago nuda]|nr:hypothetical protein NDA18_000477 [Ustilago nuda]
MKARASPFPSSFFLSFASTPEFSRAQIQDGRVLPDGFAVQLNKFKMRYHVDERQTHLVASPQPSDEIRRLPDDQLAVGEVETENAQQESKQVMAEQQSTIWGSFCSSLRFS